MVSTAPALFTEICRVGSNVLLPVISIGAGLCLRRRHTQDKAESIGQNREVAAGVLPLGCFCSCVGPAWERGTGRNSGNALGL